MKKLSVLMSALVMALAFVACEKDEPTPAPKLEVTPTEVTVTVGEEGEEVSIKGGVAPYTVTSADDKVVAVTEVNEGKFTVSAVEATEEPAPEVTEGEETPAPVVVDVTVADKEGTKVVVKVTVKAAEDNGDEA